MVDPGLAEPGKRVRIGVEQAVILEDQLSGAEMPPDVRVGNTRGRHGEQTKGEDSDKDPASLQKPGHGGE